MSPFNESHLYWPCGSHCCQRTETDKCVSSLLFPSLVLCLFLFSPSLPPFLQFACLPLLLTSLCLPSPPRYWSRRNSPSAWADSTTVSCEHWELSDMVWDRHDTELSSLKESFIEYPFHRLLLVTWHTPWLLWGGLITLSSQLACRSPHGKKFRSNCKLIRHGSIRARKDRGWGGMDTGENRVPVSNAKRVL